MCELSELSELSPLDAVESLCVKDETGRNEWGGSLFRKDVGIRSPYLDRGAVCSAIYKI